MNAHSVVEDWETAPFGGGFEGLVELGSRGFDGAVEAADTWLFLRGGEPIAVVSDLQSDPRPGDIDAFEGASGRKHEAPEPAAVTLAAMLALDGEVRGRYYTDDTPLSAVHETLSGGGFTGYVELSENVLSGDYYYVYVDGEVDHLGFVGSSQRLYGEEAQTKAENEVGIYAVAAVSLPDLELPEVTKDASTEPTGTSGTSASDSDSDLDSTSTPEAESASEPVAEPRSEREPGTETAPESAPEPESAAAASEAEPTAEEPSSASEEHSAPDDDRASDETAAESPADPAAADTGDSTSAADAAAPSERTTDDGFPESGSSPPVDDGDEPDRSAESPSASRSTESERRPSGDVSSGVGGLATRRVPSLDPDRSGRAEPDAPASSGRSTDRSGGGKPEAERTAGSARTAGAQTRVRTDEAAEPSREAAEEKLSEYEARIDELETTVDERETKIDELEAELEAVRAERDELKARLESMDTATDAGGRELSPDTALEGTSLFVRERERGAATLEDAHDGAADREAVSENLRIEYHTTFDSTDVTVEDQPFETWLRSTPPYAFAEWLVTELLFEIRSTNAQEGLSPLYDALPVIDRIGFEETIELGTDPESDDDLESAQFDIVARDKKGNPLVVANFDRSREPTRADTIQPFIADSSDVCEANETLAAAVSVSSSYFESDAMDITEEATSTSLLSRSKYRSYVKLARSNGYHLCLVEARNDTFDLTVPELN